MRIFELPVVYAVNFKEVNAAAEQGLPQSEVIEDIKKTTFIIPDESFIRVNENAKPHRTTLWFDPVESYIIDSDYEAVMIVLKRATKL